MSQALAVVEDEGHLTPRERRFALEYLWGEFASNGRRCYLKAFGLPEEKYDYASSQASILLRRPRIERFLQELREHVLTGGASSPGGPRGLRDWLDVAIEAQETVIAVMQGTLRSRLQLDAAREVLNRALGQPVARTELEVVNQQRASKALLALKKRMAKDEKVELVDGHRLALGSGGDSG